MALPLLLIHIFFHLILFFNILGHRKGLQTHQLLTLTNNMTQDNKTIKCELTVKQLFFLMKSTKKWKKGFRKHFLNNAGVTKYLNNQLMNNSKVEELEKLKQEWKEDLAIWEKEHHLESKKKVEKKKPEKEVWGDINSF